MAGRIECSPRQAVLNQLFRHSSAVALVKSRILEQAQTVSRDNDDDDIFRFLELGCGFGVNTFDVASMLPESAHITAVDTNPDLIEAAKRNLSLEHHQKFQGRIDFVAMSSSEEIATSLAGQFDAVWARLVGTYTLDPVALVKTAKECLKPGGIMLLEVPGGGSGKVIDPPVFAVSCLKVAYGAERERLSLRGIKVGNYMNQVGGLEDMHCDSFHALTGKGILIPPWLGVQETPLGTWPTQEQLLELAIDFTSVSINTMENRLSEMKESITLDDLNKSRKSLDEIADRDYQLFGRIGIVLQWWATKSKGGTE